ncbi:MAG: hypothetical protein M1816_005907 [Peltula sp. TS41687]|nr:MAG: hypothetical protein M1816_005907 [Peltula sp. TS41687]
MQDDDIGDVYLHVKQNFGSWPMVARQWIRARDPDEQFIGPINARMSRVHARLHSWPRRHDNAEVTTAIMWTVAGTINHRELRLAVERRWAERFGGGLQGYEPDFDL